MTIPLGRVYQESLLDLATWGNIVPMTDRSKMQPAGPEKVEKRLSARDVERLRSETPGCEDKIHLKACGSALMPRSVFDTVVSHLELESRMGGYEAGAASAEAIAEAYGSLARLLGCEPRNVAFVENATVGFAQALSAIPFEPGDVILMSREEYVSNRLMFLSLARRFGIEPLVAPSLPEGGVDTLAMRRMMDQKRPKLVAVTHVPTNSGLVQPVAEIGRACRAAGVLYLVDACQSVGQMPVSSTEIGCDFLCGTSRKFLRGPRGMGFLYVSDRVLEAGLEPLFIDTRGATWQEREVYVRSPTAQRFENWEFSHALVLGLGEAARYATAVGLEAIEHRATSLANLARQRLTAAGLRVLDRGAHPCAIATVAIPAWGGAAFQDELARRGIHISFSNRCSAVVDFDDKGVDWALRIAPHYYNTESEIETVVETISDLLYQGSAISPKAMA